MRSVGGYVTLVVLLVVAGAVAWFAGKSEERLAAAEYSLVTLRYDRAASELQAATSPGLLDPIVRRLSPVSGDESAAASYWTGDDEGLSSSDDPAVKLLAANAEYRALRRARRAVADGRRPSRRDRQALRRRDSPAAGQRRRGLQLRVRAAFARDARQLAAGAGAERAVARSDRARYTRRAAGGDRREEVQDDRADAAGRAPGSRGSRPRRQEDPQGVAAVKMLTSFDLSGLRFTQPIYLWLLVLPGILLIVWAWQAWRRRADIHQMRKHRHLPGRRATAERLPLFGDLVWWLCLILALASTIVAVARPVAVASMVRTSGVDQHATERVDEHNPRIVITCR